MHKLQNVKISRDTDAWEVELKAELPAEEMKRYRDGVIKEFQKTSKIDGFREGKAPIERVIKHVGEEAILHHAAEHAVQEELPNLLATEKLLIVATPKVTIEPPKQDFPLSFTARAPLAPEIALPDYKEIAKKQGATKKEQAVTDEEHAQVFTHLRRERARIEKTEKGLTPAQAADEARALGEKDLPELDDAFAQTLGYENAKTFSESVRANIKTEKDLREAEKCRAGLLDELVKNTKISYPALLREYELEEMESQFTHDLSRAGTTMEGYLNETKKTREQLRAEWKETADKRARVRLILSEIARKESIEPDPKRLEHEIEHARKHYKNANEGALRAHIAHALKNEAVLKFLENQVH